MIHQPQRLTTLTSEYPLNILSISLHSSHSPLYLIDQANKHIMKLATSSLLLGFLASVARAAPRGHGVCTEDAGVFGIVAVRPISRIE